MLVKMQAKPSHGGDYCWTIIPALYGVTYEAVVTKHPDNIVNPATPTGFEMIREVKISIRCNDPESEPIVFWTSDNAYILNDQGTTIERIN